MAAKPSLKCCLQILLPSSSCSCELIYRKQVGERTPSEMQQTSQFKSFCLKVWLLPLAFCNVDRHVFEGSLLAWILRIWRGASIDTYMDIPFAPKVVPCIIVFPYLALKANSALSPCLNVIRSADRTLHDQPARFYCQVLWFMPPER